MNDTPTTSRALNRLSEVLRIALLRRYQAAAIPSDEDELIGELLGVLGTEPTAALAVNRTLGGLLLSFAVRSATRAVRDSDPRQVDVALEALARGGSEEDPRDLLSIACAIYDSCGRIGVDPRSRFEFAARRAGGGVAVALKTFASLKDDEVALDRWQVRVEESPDGFRYALI